MPFRFQADQYPTNAGCYLMKNKEGELLYIGKAKNIRKRLRSYFTRQHTERKLIQLVEQVDSIDVMLVNNEAESLLLENNLIKQHKPPFNKIASRHSPRQMGQGFPRTTKLALLLLRRGSFSLNSFFHYGKYSRNIWSVSSKTP